MTLYLSLEIFQMAVLVFLCDLFINFFGIVDLSIKLFDLLLFLNGFKEVLVTLLCSSDQCRRNRCAS